MSSSSNSSIVRFRARPLLLGFACPGTCTGTPHPPQSPQCRAMASPGFQLVAHPRAWLRRPVSRHVETHDIPTGCSLQECDMGTSSAQTPEHSAYTLQMCPYLELCGNLHFLPGIARHIGQHCQRSRVGWLLHRHQPMLQSGSRRQQCLSRCTEGDEGQSYRCSEDAVVEQPNICSPPSTRELKTASPSGLLATRSR